MATTLLLLAVLLQEADAPRIRSLIRQLGAESVQEREEAVRGLERLGKAALPAIRRAARHADPEISSRAAYLLRLNAIRERLTPRLRKAMPGVESRLAAGGAAAWTSVFLEASRRSRYPFLEPDDLDPLVADAFRGASSPEQRMSLSATARRHHLRSAIPGLIPLLVDPDRRVREFSAEALFDLKPAEALSDIATLLERGAPRAQTAAVLLGRLNAVQTLPYVRRLLSDPRAPVRTCALAAVAALRSESAAGDAVSLLEDPDGGVRQGALRALRLLNARSEAGAVARRLEDGSARVRTEAVVTLSGLGARDRSGSIAGRLDDADAGVRRAAVGALLHLRARAFAGDLAARLRDPDAGVRASAVEALVRLDAREHVRGLIALLGEPDANVLHAVIWGLGELRVPEASPPLARILADPRVDIRINVLMALGRIGVGDVVPDVRRRLTDPKPIIRATAARILGRHAIPGVFPDLVERLRDEDALVRGSAARSLGRLGRQDAEPALEKLLSDRGDAESASRRGLDEVLRETQSWHVRASIDDLYRRSHPLVRVTAAFALCRLGSGRGIPLVLDHADESGVDRECIALNAVRKPALWKRLRAARVREPIRGTPLEAFGALAAAVGLKFERGARTRQVVDEVRIDPEEAPTTVAAALETLAIRYRYNLILESDRIRIVSGRDFLEFWIAWHAGR